MSKHTLQKLAAIGIVLILIESFLWLVAFQTTNSTDQVEYLQNKTFMVSNTKYKALDFEPLTKESL